MTNIIDEELFAKTFGYPLKALANKLIYTINKEKNQIIVNNINKNKKKLYETSDFNDYVIQTSDRRINFINDINLLLEFNEKIQLDGD